MEVKEYMNRKDKLDEYLKHIRGDTKNCEFLPLLYKSELLAPEDNMDVQNLEDKDIVSEINNEKRLVYGVVFHHMCRLKKDKYGQMNPLVIEFESFEYQDPVTKHIFDELKLKLANYGYMMIIKPIRAIKSIELGSIEVTIE